MNQTPNNKSMSQSPKGRSSHSAGSNSRTNSKPSRNQPSSTTGCNVRRAHARSQIPVRVPSHAPSRLHTHCLPQRSSLTVAYHNATLAQPDDVRSLITAIEAVFSVYSARAQADLHEFRALCTRLVAKEAEVKDQWHSLCVKVMKERDAALQRLHRVLVEQRAVAMRQPSPTSDSATRGTKRASGDGGDSAARDASPPFAYWPEAASRPMVGLRSSPVPSPPAAPPRNISPPASPPHSSGTPPPITASSPPTTPAGAVSTVSPQMLFDASRKSSPALSTGSESDLRYSGEDAEPRVKRRRSCDSQISINSGVATLVEPSTPDNAEGCPPGMLFSIDKFEPFRDGKSRLNLPQTPPRGPKCALPLPLMKPTTAPPVPNDFSHVDIMYIPTNDNLVCRACRLESNKSDAKIKEPTSFPKSATWDQLREHCLREHPSECADVARLHPAEIFTLRRRLNM